jgi:hypothetical protein
MYLATHEYLFMWPHAYGLYLYCIVQPSCVRFSNASINIIHYKKGARWKMGAFISLHVIRQIWTDNKLNKTVKEKLVKDTNKPNQERRANHRHLYLPWLWTRILFPSKKVLQRRHELDRHSWFVTIYVYCTDVACAKECHRSCMHLKYQSTNKSWRRGEDKPVEKKSLGRLRLSPAVVPICICKQPG